METRYRMQKGKYLVEAHRTDEGKKSLREIRKMMPNTFKGARIREIIQAMPSEIPVETVVWDGWKKGDKDDSS